MSVLKKKNNYGVVLSIISIIISFLLGYLIYPISNIEIEPKDSLVSYLNLFITVILLFYVPYFIEKRLKERRAIKDYLIADIKEIVKRTEELKAHITECARSGSTSKTDISIILGLLRNISNSNNQIKDILYSVFSKRKAKDLIQNLEKESNQLWEIITEGEFMISGFKIDDDFSAKANRACLKFISSYKTEVVKINRL